MPAEAVFQFHTYFLKFSPKIYPFKHIFWVWIWENMYEIENFRAQIFKFIVVFEKISPRAPMFL